MARFATSPRKSGLNQNNTRYSFCCGWGDFNRDGWPDLYVVNDFGRKNLYRNNGDGTFTDVATQAGVEDVGAGMSVCWFDYDNDGAEDLYVADMWTAAGERISTQEIFQQDATPEIRALISQTRDGQFRFSEITATEHSQDTTAHQRRRHGPLVMVERRLGFRSRRLPRSLHRQRNGFRRRCEKT